MLSPFTHFWVAAVGFLHVYIWILEMFLWRKPLGLKAFRMKPAQAEATAVLAANQGLYNLFLAAGLLVSFVLSEDVAFAFRVFFFSCVAVAGLYGAYSVSRRILWIQTIPAGVGLALLGAGCGCGG